MASKRPREKTSLNQSLTQSHTNAAVNVTIAAGVGEALVAAVEAVVDPVANQGHVDATLARHALEALVALATVVNAGQDGTHVLSNRNE